MKKVFLLSLLPLSCVTTEKKDLPRINVPYELLSATAFQLCAPMHFSLITLWGDGQGKIECKDNQAFMFQMDPIAEDPDLELTIEHSCEDE